MEWNGEIANSARGQEVTIVFHFSTCLVSWVMKGRQDCPRLKETVPVLATWLIVNSKAVKILYPIVVKVATSDLSVLGFLAS